ncbi:MAG: FAD:protein FMN transferase [Endomicrobiales bacterium]|nr:FAD:protein FMN transferase [Endomicrobiales bacterium]
MKKEILIIASLVFILTSCLINNHKITKETKVLMDTFVEIKAENPNQISLDPVWKEAERLIKIFDNHSKEGEISLINKNSGVKPAIVSKEVSGLLEKAIHFSEESDGIFDPTVVPLVNLWKKSAKTKTLPTLKELNYAKKNINYKKIRIKGTGVYLPVKGMSLGLGAIAKGFIVDKMVNSIKELGIENGIVNAGGDIRAFGKREWKIGIQHPRNPAKVLFVLKIKNQSIATSGDYERFFLLNGKRYNHIIDPRTGYPADKSISATVITSKAADADALATIAFILGPKDGIAFISKIDETECVIIDPAGKVFATSGLLDEIKIKNISI